MPPTLLHLLIPLNAVNELLVTWILDYLTAERVRVGKKSKEGHFRVPAAQCFCDTS